jgi:hypothetical protein
MCDYSLRAIQNRLAEEGEELVSHRFERGTLGFVAVSDLIEWRYVTDGHIGGFWSTMKEWLLPRRAPRLPAVCIAPGTPLLLSEVPPRTQAALGLGSSEVVIVSELSNRSYSYREALLLPNGTRVLLQDLPEGLHAVVLSSSREPLVEPEHTELRVAAVAANAWSKN